MNQPIKPDYSSMTFAEQQRALDQYQRDLAAWEAKQPREGGPDTSAVGSFFSNFGNELLWGGGDELAGGVMAGGEGMAADIPASIDRAAEYMDESQRQHPTASMIGGTLGALAGGGAFAKGLAKAGQAIPGVRTAMRLGDSPLGRSIGQAMVAAGESTLNAALEGRDIAPEATFGGILGFGSQLTLGELVPGMVNAGKGVPTVKDKEAAKTYFRKFLDGAGYGGDAQAIDHLVNEAYKLGPNATMVDLHPTFRDTGLALRRENYNGTDAMTYKLRSRMPDDPYAATVGELFEGKIPRAPQQLESVLGAYKKEVSPAFQEAYTSPAARGIGGNPFTFSQSMIDVPLSRTRRKENLPAFTAARKKLNKVIADNTRDANGKPWLSVDTDGKLVPAKGRDRAVAMKHLKDLDANTIHVLRRQIDTMIDSANRGKQKLNPTVVAHLAQVRSNLTNKLNSIPEFKQASAQFKQAEDFSAGYDLGYSLLDDASMDPRDFAATVDALDDDASSALIEGVSAKLRNMYENDQDAFAKLMSNDSSHVYQKLVTAFGKPRTLQLANNVDRLDRFGTMLNKMEEAGSPAQSAGHTPLGSMLDIAMMTSLAVPQRSVSRAAGLGAARREAALLPLPGQKRMEQALIDDLAQQSPETIELFLQGIRDRQRTDMPSDIVGGAVGSLPSVFTQEE